NARLAALGVRIVVNGHAAYFAAIKATYDCLREQRQVDALDLNASQLSVKYSTADEYVVWAEEYMQVKE
ncbi:MAG TPA: oxaloacetate decarboxylase, partial [Pseudomonas sp.]|nr:oxaloacetate decarboxylase [Pseudomonas sp.]